MSRNIWFVTRPERDPKFHPEALECLKIATDDFKTKWKGNRNVHKQYEKTLCDNKLKRNSISNDGSGGRTWCAMLRTFGYCYLSDDGYIIPTKVGIAILKNTRVFDNIKKQLLTLQIPNTYFLGGSFRPKYSDEFKIRPVRFLIKLCTSSILDFYLTKEEITYFVLTAKTDNSINDVISNIAKFRTSEFDIKIQIKSDITNKFDHRVRSDSVARNYFQAHSDVAHTFMMLCDYTGLVEYKRGDGLYVDSLNLLNVLEELDFYDQRYPFNSRYLYSPTLMAENSGLDIDSYKASSYGEKKPVNNAIKNKLLIDKIKASFPIIYSAPKDEVVKVLRERMNERDAYSCYNDIKYQEKFEALSDLFVENYITQVDPIKFEDQTGSIFKSIGFDVVMRPKHNGDSKTEIEILLKYGEKFGIIDAKLYKKKFTLTANLANHMAIEYIKEYDGYKNLELTFFGYVASADIGGEKNLNKISKTVKNNVLNREIHGFMINAKTLLSFLDYCITENLPKSKRIEKFIKLSQNISYDSFSKLKRVLE